LYPCKTKNSSLENADIVKLFPHQLLLDNLPRWNCTAKKIAVLGLVSSVTVGALHENAIAATSSQNTAQVLTLVNRADVSYTIDGETIQVVSNTITQNSITGALIDPKGQITGCGGKPLDDYTGFSVALYEPLATDPTASTPGNLLTTTETELPDILNNEIPKGINPNNTNQNPYFLTNATEGRYSFLLDRSKGQLELGKIYILAVTPPNTSIYSLRQIKLQITDLKTLGEQSVVTYRAISLDGLPIGIEGELVIEQTVLLIEDADQIGLQLLAFQLTNGLCNRNQIQITKSGDRASAEPGDTVIYRLSVKNTSDITLNNINITDILPEGFKFFPQSVRGEFKGVTVPITVTSQGRTVQFRADLNLPVGETFNIAYAAQLTTDALRGSGKNLAEVSGQRTDNKVAVQNGPAIHRVRIGSGLFTDCGTLLGRVFEDKNFDGEQQTGEPGIPNAVVYMNDGNRITTDPNGLFNVKCVLPGYHTGVLDPLSVPDYRLAPNQKFIESNSASRIVRMEPGGMARMNFGVMPKTGEHYEK
jgi:uncharacterized repeat protein (TIGR01451 family)